MRRRQPLCARRCGGNALKKRRQSEADAQCDKFARVYLAQLRASEREINKPPLPPPPTTSHLDGRAIFKCAAPARLGRQAGKIGGPYRRPRGGPMESRRRRRRERFSSDASERTNGEASARLAAAKRSIKFDRNEPPPPERYWLRVKVSIVQVCSSRQRCQRRAAWAGTRPAAEGDSFAELARQRRREGRLFALAATGADYSTASCPPAGCARFRPPTPDRFVWKL